MDLLVSEIVNEFGTDIAIVAFIFILLILAARFLFSLGLESIINTYKAELNKKEIQMMFVVYISFIIELLIIFNTNEYIRKAARYPIILLIVDIILLVIKNNSRNYILGNNSIKNSLFKNIFFVYCISFALIFMFVGFLISNYAEIKNIIGVGDIEVEDLLSYSYYLLNVVIIFFLTFISMGYSVAIGMLNLLNKYEFIFKDGINNKTTICAYLIAENDIEYLIKDDSSAAMYIKKGNILAIKCIQNNKKTFIDSIKSFWNNSWHKKNMNRGHAI